MNTLAFQLSVSFIKENDQFVAFSPALDLSTAGKTLEEAKKHFTEAAQLFFEELKESGNTEEVLSGLGWAKKNDSFIPPMIVSQQIESIRIPAF
ncbi:MAG: hypothetical protein A3A33_01300 [Candidatus Yanofskybacteria bacterium RIFCSPLOWO2_01_FULL_49_25]|uniref:HicB-like antitoxin of toxin-antitoxin system domain-containing protein n=1 Tax=Candidatus Yanofskybacteria bacterium RIFCSPLOWO2_01_FULL_49_25 TaxID=1802701 RepID=A0A1F8GWZ2_9BACT|nr:MAG: hypothetical protein A3A33_01300 [Candidatus Yanofskybacteria bacterium RIFCSPLOWO2_01_FULL_49_25]